MMRDGVVVASGIAVGEESSEYGVRGAGRLVDADWFKSIGYRYPLIYGFEPWLIFKALSQGYNARTYDDLKFKLIRPTRVSPRKAFLWGKAMKVVGYLWPYAISRSVLLSMRSLALGVHMIAGFISSVESSSDISDFMKELQKRRYIEKLKKFFVDY